MAWLEELYPIKLNFKFFLFLSMFTMLTFNVIGQVVTTRFFQANNIPVTKVDSLIRSSEPYKTVVDSFLVGKKRISLIMMGTTPSFFTDYNYDSNGRLLSELSHPPNSIEIIDSVIREYDKKGRVVSISDHNILENTVYLKKMSYSSNAVIIQEQIDGSQIVKTLVVRYKSKPAEERSRTYPITRGKYLLTKYDKFDQVLSESKCEYGKCRLCLQNKLFYDRSGRLIKKLICTPDGKVFNVTTLTYKKTL